MYNAVLLDIYSRYDMEEPMQTEHLRQFAAVVRYGSVSEAARRLHMTQPALSRSLRHVEQELGCELFDRSGRRLAPNEAGAVVGARAEAIVREEDRMREEVEGLKRRRRTLRIGTCAPAPLWHLTSLIVQADPQAVVRPETLGMDELARGLESGSLDAAIFARGARGLGGPPRLPGFCERRLMRETIGVSVPPGSPLAGKASLSWQDLDGETFLARSDIGVWGQIRRRMAPGARLIEVDDIEVLRQLEEASDLPYFNTDAPILGLELRGAGGRVRVPISGPEASLDFCLVAPESPKGCLAQVMEGLEAAEAS